MSDVLTNVAPTVITTEVTDASPEKRAPIWKAVDKLGERLMVLEEKLKTTQAEGVFASVRSTVHNDIQVNPDVLIQQALNPPKISPEYPIPSDYREAVNFILNDSFGIKIDHYSDRNSFMFSIIVPERYSNTPPAQRPDVEDLRSKVITAADGVNGVRLWAERVYSNFNKETQDLIIQDRPFVNKSI